MSSLRAGHTVGKGGGKFFPRLHLKRQNGLGEGVGSFSLAQQFFRVLYVFFLVLFFLHNKVLFPVLFFLFEIFVLGKKNCPQKNPLRMHEFFFFLLSLSQF